MMDDNKHRHKLTEELRRYNQPPPTPREEMWAHIQIHRPLTSESSPDQNERHSFWARLLPSNRMLLFPAAAAAILLLGILVGRLSIQPGIDRELSVPTAAGIENRESQMYQVAASHMLGNAETLLTQYQIGQLSQPNGRTFTDRAASLLAETRLLIDSPAAEDPVFSRLLDDLEFTLTQIVQTGAQRHSSERDWILSGLDQRAMLNRLRTMTARDSRHSL
jgi:hypothetical protein